MAGALRITHRTGIHKPSGRWTTTCGTHTAHSTRPKSSRARWGGRAEGEPKQVAKPEAEQQPDETGAGGTCTQVDIITADYMPKPRSPSGEKLPPPPARGALRCRALTTSGKRCKAWAGIEGLCSYHRQPQTRPPMIKEKTKRMKYWDHLRSPWWLSRRRAALAEVAGLCQHCGSTRNLQVHHLTYDHLGNEPITDLAVLCKRCHRLEHHA